MPSGNKLITLFTLIYYILKLLTVCRQKQMMERVQIYCAVHRKAVQVATPSL